MPLNLSLSFGRIGHLCVAGPQASVRAFGTAPYLRVVPVPALKTRAIAVRAGSVLAWCMADPRPGKLPVAFYLELSIVPGHVLRAAWMRGAGRMLREELFPS